MLARSRLTGPSPPPRPRPRALSLFSVVHDGHLCFLVRPRYIECCDPVTEHPLFVVYFRLHSQLLRRRVSVGDVEDDTLEALIAMLGERFPSVVGERSSKKPGVFFSFYNSDIYGSLLAKGVARGVRGITAAPPSPWRGPIAFYPAVAAVVQFQKSARSLRFSISIWRCLWPHAIHCLCGGWLLNP